MVSGELFLLESLWRRFPGSRNPDSRNSYQRQLVDYGESRRHNQGQFLQMAGTMIQAGNLVTGNMVVVNTAVDVSIYRTV